MSNRNIATSIEKNSRILVADDNEVNQKFAHTIVEHCRENDFIWIHDYHLMSVARELRSLGLKNRLAFFLHIPFPPYDVFRLLPWDRELLRGMLAADLIGVHVRSYATNFFDCAERSLGARVNRTDGLVEYGDHTTRIGAFPLGIDFDLFESLALDDGDRSKNPDERVVLGGWSGGGSPYYCEKPYLEKLVPGGWRWQNPVRIPVRHIRVCRPI